MDLPNDLLLGVQHDLAVCYPLISVHVKVDPAFLPFSVYWFEMCKGKNRHYQGEHCPPLLSVAVVSARRGPHIAVYFSQLLVPEMPAKFSIKCLLIIHAVLKQMCAVLSNLCVSHLLEFGFHNFNGKMC